MHAATRPGYGALMTQTPEPQTPEPQAPGPLSAPADQDGQPAPVEPSATNPDADGIDDEDDAPA